MMFLMRSSLVAGVLLCCAGFARAEEPALEQPANTWVKRSPLKSTPPSPMLGYEGSFGYDPANKRLIRWAGHNQGGGGEQNAETWTFDPVTARWMLMEPNLSPPGVCCAQQNVFDPAGGRFLRFQAFSGSHGWQWFREIYLNNTSVWSYNLASNTWRDMRAHPSPRTYPLRCAAWDSEHQVAVVFGGEGSHEGTLVYDPYVNTWMKMQPPKEPAERSGGNMAYDAAQHRHILFGTQFGDDPHTWSYDLRTNTWTDLKPATMPPTKESDAVLAYDEHSQRIVCVVQIVEKSEDGEASAGRHETWTYDSARNEWTRMQPAQEPQGWGNRRRIMAAVPDQNVVLLESYVNPTTKVPGIDREQQIWTYRSSESTRSSATRPPENIVVATQADSATLRWQAQPDAQSYTIFAGDGETPWKIEFQKLATVPKNQHAYEDSCAPRGKPRFYYVCANDASGKPGEPSRKVRTQPKLVEDVVASVISPSEVRLSWPKPAANDILGYHVERAIVEPFSEDQIERLRKDTLPLAEPSVGGIKAIGPFERLTAEPISVNHYADQAVDLRQVRAIAGKPIMTHRFPDDRVNAQGKPYRYGVHAYRVLAVNKLGVESGPGPLAFTIPSSPQWVFAKEDGETCHLKWTANPEQELRGYRVYRMESPRINGPGQPTTRVTPEPTGEPRFTDPQAGDATRRYWIVAVDGLGQEGFPSAPVWHQRQYRSIYQQFTSEWHQ
jgi:hypothetical protein